MELVQLIQFREIVQHGNMSKAAAALFVSQPALSQNLAKLESELGVMLFERKKNRIEINENGLIALEHVNRILEELELMRAALNPSPLSRHTLYLGASEDPSLRYFGATIISQYPDIELITMTRAEKELEEKLLDKEIDIAFTENPLEGPELFTTYLFTDQIKISVPEGHPYFTHDSITWGDLENQPLIEPVGESYVLNAARQILKKKKISIKRFPQKDISLYWDILSTTQYLYLTTKMAKKIDAKNLIRKTIPLVNPTIRIRFFASCHKDQVSSLLHYITAIQRYYWALEEMTEQ